MFIKLLYTVQSLFLKHAMTLCFTTTVTVFTAIASVLFLRLRSLFSVFTALATVFTSIRSLFLQQWPLFLRLRSLFLQLWPLFLLLRSLFLQQWPLFLLYCIGDYGHYCTVHVHIFLTCGLYFTVQYAPVFTATVLPFWHLLFTLYGQWFSNFILCFDNYTSVNSASISYFTVQLLPCLCKKGLCFCHLRPGVVPTGDRGDVCVCVCVDMVWFYGIAKIEFFRRWCQLYGSIRGNPVDKI